jgi:hypothetical protein
LLQLRWGSELDFRSPQALPAAIADGIEKSFPHRAGRIPSLSTTDLLHMTAFLNSAGKIAVVLRNLSDQMQPFNLFWAG